ncbi:hypothetical protein LZ554_005230 [Drepanopeziza brunnea f. sp. 'monogermtubi']|nr:hypothetical protein LZ554_005230 [Drepanopeziza brunnea f. sp. 'monogermtubi']
MSSHQVTVSPKDGADGKPDFNNQERPNLTFGIEFEFALATLPPRYEDPDPKDRRQVRDLSHPPFKVDRSEAPSKCLYRTEVQTPLLAAELQIIQDHVATRLEERGLKSVGNFSLALAWPRIRRRTA